MNFFEKYNLFNKNQFGFKNECSTAIALTNSLINLYEKYDQKIKFVDILLDISKAFYIVNEKLFKKWKSILYEEHVWNGSVDTWMIENTPCRS